MRRVTFSGACASGFIVLACVLVTSFGGGRRAHAAASGSDGQQTTRTPSVTPQVITFDWGAPDAPVGLVQQATIRNDGDAASQVTAVALSQPFELGPDTCSGTTLAPASTCTLDVSWKPSQPTSATGVLVVETTNGRTSTVVYGNWSAIPTTCWSSTCAGSAEALGQIAPLAEQRLAACDSLAGKVVVQYPTALAIAVGENVPIKVTAIAGDVPTTTTPDTADAALATVSLGLSCEVRARLYNQDFVISPSQDWQAYSFLGTPQIEWLWKVETQRAGRQDLVLEIQSTPIISGMRLGSTGPPPYQLAIDVHAAGRSVGATTTNLFRRIVDYPLVSGFGSLVAVGGGIFASMRWVRSRRNARLAPPSTAPDPPPTDGPTAAGE